MSQSDRQIHPEMFLWEHRADISRIACEPSIDLGGRKMPQIFLTIDRTDHAEVFVGGRRHNAPHIAESETSNHNNINNEI